MGGSIVTGNSKGPTPAELRAMQEASRFLAERAMHLGRMRALPGGENFNHAAATPSELAMHERIAAGGPRYASQTPQQAPSTATTVAMGSDR